jgi:hypothetical protein
MKNSSNHWLHTIPYIRIGIAFLMIGCSKFYKFQSISNFEISYRDENYVVPIGEVWKLTWISPYEEGVVHPAYDVRVLGSVYTSIDMNTRIMDHSPGSETQRVNVFAQRDGPATIWVDEGTEFYLANEYIKVAVESYKSP